MAAKMLLTTGVAYLRSFVAGVSSAVFNPSGVITTSTVQAGTAADLVETDLWTYTLPANALNANGKGVRVTIWGTVGANANSKTIKAYFAGTQVAAQTTTANAAGWVITATILRTGASAQLGGATVLVDLLAAGRAQTTTPAGDTTASIIIKFTGQNGSAVANDVVFRGAVVEYLG